MPVERTVGWTSHGPYGGNVGTLSMNPDHPDALYAGTSAGLFKSEDGGMSWKRLDIEFYLNSSVAWVGVAPSDPNVVYVREDTRRVHDFLTVLYRSDDAGETWQQALYVEDSFRNLNVSIDPTDASTFYAAPVNAAALKSTDGGRSGSAILSFASSILVDPTLPSTLYGNVFEQDESGTFFNDLQKSLDGGMTWATAGLVSEGEWVAVDPLDSRNIYADGLQFQRSDDGGASVSPDTTSPGQIRTLAFGAGTPRRLYAVVVEDTGAVLYTSTDRGATWSRAGAPPGGLGGLAVTPISSDQDRILAGGGEGGVFLSTDGGVSWTPRSGGLNAAWIASIAVFPSDGRTAYALGPGFARTEDGGATWSVDPFAPVASNGDVAVDPTDRNIVYASAATAGVLRSTDGGVTWTPTFPTAHAVTSIAIDPKTPTTLYMADGWPLKSTNSGGTWSVVNKGIPYGVTRIAVDPSDPSGLYAASSGLYRSRDAGGTWSLVLPDFVVTIASDPGHPGTVYAGSGSGVWKSVDWGSTWSPTGSLGSMIGVTSLACDGSGVIYAASYSTNPYFNGSGTPLQSADGGANWGPVGGWEMFRSGFPSGDIAVAVDSAGSLLYVGTGGGVWQFELRRTRTGPTRPTATP